MLESGESLDRVDVLFWHDPSAHLNGTDREMSDENGAVSNPKNRMTRRVATRQFHRHARFDLVGRFDPINGALVHEGQQCGTSRSIGMGTDVDQFGTANDNAGIWEQWRPSSRAVQ